MKQILFEFSDETNQTLVEKKYKGGFTSRIAVQVGGKKTGMGQFQKADEKQNNKHNTRQTGEGKNVVKNTRRGSKSKIQHQANNPKGWAKSQSQRTRQRSYTIIRARNKRSVDHENR